MGLPGLGRQASARYDHCGRLVELHLDMCRPSQLNWTDSPAQESLLLSHLLLSMPITRLRDHPLSAGPIFNSHFYDLQVPSHPVLSAVVPSHQGSPSHSGPPAANIEVKLAGPGVETSSDALTASGDDKAVRKDNILKGTVWVRGPAVLERVDGGGEIVEG